MSVRQYVTKNTCFGCGKTIDGPHVQWEGHLGTELISIHLHDECAEHMSTALKRDVLEFQLGRESAERWYRTLQTAAASVEFRISVPLLWNPSREDGQI
jgi:hypothetical protein